MSTLPPINRISKEDLKDAPAWIDRLLYPLNLFFDSVYRGLNHSLTFQENIDSQQISFSLTAGAAALNNTAKFTVDMKNKPTGLLLKSATLVAGNYTPIGQPVFVEWYYESGFINVTAISGLTVGKVYNFTILLI
jgi:hypothetical protein